MHPNGKVTYLVDRNINYTNVCTINCQFCSFYWPPGHDETYTQTYEEISVIRVSELEAIGGSRILMQGGVNPSLPFAWYIDCFDIPGNTIQPSILDCFSPIEIEGIAEVCNLSTLEVLTQLKEAGMHGLPGGGVEMLVDDVRKDVSPKKGAPANWLRVMEEAQLGVDNKRNERIGLAKHLAERVEHMRRIRELQDRSLSQKIIRIYFLHRMASSIGSQFLWSQEPGGQNKHELGAGSSEYLRHVAVSRLFLDNVEHIQASWPTMGIHVAQMALLGGADDAGSTMMEENVVSASGTTKLEATELELQSSILRAGFTPQRRDSDYRHLKTHIMSEGVDSLAAPTPTMS